MAEDTNPDLKISTVSERTGGIRTRGGRIPPIRSRDLGQPGRRVYVPNIPQRRIKVKEDKTKTEENSNQSSNSNRDDRRNRGRGRGKREYIQTTGSLFGQGVGEDASQKREPRDISCLKQSSIAKPVFTSKKEKSKKEQLEEDQKCLDRDKFDESESDGEDVIKPIVLPLKVPIKTEIKMEPDLKLKIKKEPNVDEIKNEMDKIVIKKEKEEPNSCDLSIKGEAKPIIETEDGLDLFCNKNAMGKMVLIQFPDKLFSENNVNSGDAQDTSNEQVIKDANDLKNMKEGVVGKLQIFKSGAVKFVCGETVMNVERKQFFNFSEELILMKGSDESNAEVTKLGKIDQHLLIFPPVGDLAIE